MNDQEYTNALIGFAVDEIMRKLDSNNSIDNQGQLFTFDDIFSPESYGNYGIDKFNLYPSSAKNGSCQDLAIFISLTGKRWKIKTNCKLNFDFLFDHVIKHCQGLCPKYTKTVAIIVDNWDDDVVSFWQANISVIKSYGVNFELRHITGNTVQKSQL